MKLLLPLGLALLLPVLASAETLVGFNPQGFLKGGPSPWTTGAEGEILLASGVELAEGLHCGGGARSGGTADAWGGAGFAAATKEESVDKEAWFAFTIAPAAGKTLSLVTLEATYFRGDNSATHYQWQYSIGGAAFQDLDEPTAFVESSIKGIPTTLNLASIPALQNVSQPVAFRLIGWGASSNGASWGFGKSTGQPVLSIQGNVQ